jgi:hypothetical protein
MQSDKFLSHIFLLMSQLENATLPWGQSWERILHKHLCKTLSQDYPHGEIRQFVSSSLSFSFDLICPSRIAKSK